MTTSVLLAQACQCSLPLLEAGIAPRWQWQAYLYAQHDLAGYSPWLAHGQKRQLATAYLALEHQWAPNLWGGHLTTSAYLSQRISNLPLFAWRDTGITLGWRRGW